MPSAPLSMLGGPGRLAAMEFVFQFTVVAIADMIVWLVCEFYNITHHLVYWLVTVYNFCIYHIVLTICSAQFDFISGCVSSRNGTSFSHHIMHFWH